MTVTLSNTLRLQFRSGYRATAVYRWGVRIGIKPGQWGWSFQELEASWQAAEEAGFDLVSCFDHATAAPAGTAAWDAPTLLAAMAGATERTRLAVDVLNASLRHPFLLAGQLAVAQAASGGRLEVGLGAGSELARVDHDVLGIPFPRFARRMDRLEACCRVFPALWRGEEVTEPELGLEAASLGPIGIEPPPITVGGSSERALEIAARHADGWNCVIGRADFVAKGRRLDELAGRRVQKIAQVFLRDVELDGIGELVARLEEEGADTVTFVLVEERGPEVVRALAERLFERNAEVGREVTGR
jgi:alkanesulfonate monooxygenase SsuD/methylene tetrahydromethanopterin reductase-like flavin-dependent oxidoreductase (luciferase family)